MLVIQLAHYFTEYAASLMLLIQL